MLEAARALIDKVIVTPGDHPDEPPGIELVGQLMDMLNGAGALANGDDAKKPRSRFWPVHLFGKRDHEGAYPAYTGRLF